MDLQKQIELTSAKIIEEKLPGMIETSVENMLKNVMDDLFSPYHDYAKDVKEMIKGKLNVNLEQWSLADYNVFIADAIIKYFNNEINEKATQPIKGLIGNIVSKIDSDVVDIQEIYDEFVSQLMDDSDEESGQFCFCVEKNERHGWYVVTIKGEENGGWSPKDIEFLVNSKDNTIFSFKTSTHWSSKKDTVDPVILTQLYNFQLYIFRLYSAQTKITFSTTNFDQEWYRNEY